MLGLTSFRVGKGSLRFIDQSSGLIYYHWVLYVFPIVSEITLKNSGEINYSLTATKRNKAKSMLRYSEIISLLPITYTYRKLNGYQNRSHDSNQGILRHKYC